jgi:hypothetical protein
MYYINYYGDEHCIILTISVDLRNDGTVNCVAVCLQKITTNDCGCFLVRFKFKCSVNCQVVVYKNLPTGNFYLLSIICMRKTNCWAADAVVIYK